MPLDLGQIDVQNSFGGKSLPITASPLVVDVDVDETRIRTVGTKRIPITGEAQHLAALAARSPATWAVAA